MRSKVKVTGNENVKIIVCSYLRQTWIGLHQSKTKMTVVDLPLYAGSSASWSHLAAVF